MEEWDKFSSAAESIEFVSLLTVEDYYNLTNNNLSDDPNKLGQLLVFNPSLYPRSELIRFNIDYGFSSKVKYRAYLNDKPIRTYTQNTFSVVDYEVQMEDHQGVILFDVPKLEPMSANIITLQIDEECGEDMCAPAIEPRSLKTN